MNKDKQPINYQWKNDDKVTIEMTGGQIQYLINLARMFETLGVIGQAGVMQLIKDGTATPVYAEDSVEDVLQKNPPKQEVSDEINKTSETPISEPIATMTVV